MQRLNDKQNVIKRYDLFTRISSPIIPTIPGQDFYCWIQSTSHPAQKNILLSSDGINIYSYRDDAFIEFKDKKWQMVTVEGNTGMLKGITRMAAHSDSGKVAIVVSE